MTNKEIYKIWAPVGKDWVGWVRPVPFISINDKVEPYQPTQMTYPKLAELNLNDKKTAIIVDLPGSQGVVAGLMIASEYGYRPIPIYNGVMEQPGSRATSDNRSILGGLVWGASILPNVDLKDDAPPVFLTDTNRLQSFRIDGSIFDNSWDVYPQDIPSENYLLNHGIERIVILGNQAARDLQAIFWDWPQKKVKIYWTDGYDKVKRINIGRPPKSKRSKRDD